MNLPLQEILASLLKEFQEANMASEVNRAHWQEIYDNSPLLREFTPSRVRIAEATVCMPLAIESMEELRSHDYGVLPRQIALMLPERLGEDRLDLANAVFEGLSKRKKHFFLNPHLAEDLLDMVRIQRRWELSDAELGMVRRHLSQLQQDFIARPNAARKTKFLYRTNEIAQLPADRLFKFEIKIIVD